jgi:hypothetical protein
MNKLGKKILHWAVGEQRAKKEQLILRKKRVYECVRNYDNKEIPQIFRVCLILLR